jgi:hypothetical protein
MPEECVDGPEVTIEVDELADLMIDYSYQRAKLTKKVGELVQVLKSGGTIPDPISVAVRPDGKKYIVDGQQRFWAALEAERPLKAKLYHVKSHDAELKLFEALNNVTSLTAAVVINAWTGPAREALTLLDQSPESKLRGLLNWKGRSQTTFNVGMVTRACGVLLSGGMGPGNIVETLKAFDAYWARNPRWGKRAVLSYSTVLSAVFPDVSAAACRLIPALALSRTCHLRWEKLYEGLRETWPMPSPQQYDKLRLLDWLKLAPTSNSVWLAQTQDAVENVWPLPASVRRRLTLR